MNINLSLMEKYEKNPVLRGLMQLVPLGIGSVIDVALCTEIERIREERVKTFFDELERGNIALSIDLLESEDFLHCFFATSKAAFNTRRREKIEFFARLLKSTLVDGNYSCTDEFEDYLNILDDLSFRELMILIKLDKFETEYPFSEGENDLQRANRFWEMYCVELTRDLAIPLDEINATLTRLNRSGCYETFIGAYFSYTGGKGKTTSTFKRLKQLIGYSVD